ncbi:MAG: hypothetical protein EKK60_16875 [Gordonia sp. (in: high G+C Gram-positive bacteria)]|nr:MAG: hypothetical protein EKK60_16875 [Gordonia sp. (in: high G+C Gram-positive bacteria)]
MVETLGQMDRRDTTAGEVTEAALVRIIQAEIRRTTHHTNPGDVLGDVGAVLHLLSRPSLLAIHGVALDVADVLTTAMQPERASHFAALARHIQEITADVG